MVLVTGTAVTGSLHEWLLFNIQFAERVNNNMDVDISASIVTVRMRTDESLMTGKILFCIFHSQGLCLFFGQAMIVFILRIKA